MSEIMRIAARLLMLLACLGAVNASAEERLAARVGTVPITIYELQREINKIMPMMVSFHGKVSREKQLEIQQKALERLIERGYKICSALKLKLTVPSSGVEALIDNARKQMTPEKFERAVGAETLAGLRAAVYRKLLAEAAEKKLIEDKISVGDEDVRIFYEKHRESYKRPRQFRASHLLVKVDPALTKEEKIALRAKAEVLRKRAVNGEDFFNLAYFNSDDRTKYVGGDLGEFHQGQMLPEFDMVLQRMEVGEISALVKTLYGYHVIKLIENHAPRQLTFEEVSAKIRKLLEDRQREELLADWLGALPAECPVEKFPF
jgi:parvulin-like peptidyl-prolyl isomerase